VYIYTHTVSLCLRVFSWARAVWLVQLANTVQISVASSSRAWTNWICGETFQARSFSAARVLRWEKVVSPTNSSKNRSTAMRPSPRADAAGGTNRDARRLISWHNGSLKSGGRRPSGPRRRDGDMCSCSAAERKTLSCMWFNKRRASRQPDVKLRLPSPPLLQRWRSTGILQKMQLSIKRQIELCVFVRRVFRPPGPSHHVTEPAS